MKTEEDFLEVKYLDWGDDDGQLVAQSYQDRDTTLRWAGRYRLELRYGAEGRTRAQLLARRWNARATTRGAVLLEEHTVEGGSITIQVMHPFEIPLEFRAPRSRKLAPVDPDTGKPRQRSSPSRRGKMPGS
jgi:hypothetical protein